MFTSYLDYDRVRIRPSRIMIIGHSLECPMTIIERRKK